jgi:hypothetical protein
MSYTLAVFMVVMKTKTFGHSSSASTLAGMTTRGLFRFLTSLALLIASAGVFGADKAGLVPTARLAVVLDIPESFPIKQLRAMTDETSAIWRPYNVRIVWVSRDLPGSPAPEDIRIVVRLAQSANPGGFQVNAEGRPVMGAIRFVDGIPDGVITLSREAIEAVILASDWNGRPLTAWPVAVQEHLAGRAVGRALAHEIGHYLLGEPAHTRAGLMRPSFKARELLEASGRRFQLQPGNLDALGPRMARLTDAGNR